MFVLLSPAKKLHEPPALPGPRTEAALMAHTSSLIRTARARKVSELRQLMDISEDLATLNHGRFQRWTTEHTAENSRQAILSFAGDVYIGLDALTLGEEDLAWAQNHVGILSGLYGLLRPLDAMQPYRLEMGTRMKTRRGGNLYDFWSDHIGKEVLSRAGETPIVNLASNEYFKSVAKQLKSHPVITPAFQDIKNGKARTLFFFTKRARGAMTRWIIENRVTEPERLQSCDVMGYRFVPDASTETKWVFQRQQPPPPK